MEGTLNCLLAWQGRTTCCVTLAGRELAGAFWLLCSAVSACKLATLPQQPSRQQSPASLLQSHAARALQATAAHTCSLLGPSQGCKWTEGLLTIINLVIVASLLGQACKYADGSSESKLVWLQGIYTTGSYKSQYGDLQRPAIFELSTGLPRPSQRPCRLQSVYR